MTRPICFCLWRRGNTASIYAQHNVRLITAKRVWMYTILILYISSAIWPWLIVCIYINVTLFVSMLKLFSINTRKVKKNPKKQKSWQETWFQWSCLDESDRHDSKLSSCYSSELPGVPHHDDEVHVGVNRGTDAAIIVDKLLFGHLGQKEMRRMNNLAVIQWG